MSRQTNGRGKTPRGHLPKERLKKLAADPKYKWYFGIGSTSRVPCHPEELHYVIADFDGKQAARNCVILFDHLDSYGYFCRIQKTVNGFHLYSNAMASFNTLLDFLTYYQADKKWLEIGRKRGYLFLADKDHVNLQWPVERMVIHGKKEIHPR